MTPPVSVVIPCRNEAEFIEQILDAVRGQSLQPCEVIVVDNGSTDGTPQIVERYRTQHPGPPIRPMRCSDEGTALALNAGVAAAQGDVIVRLDAHSRPAPDYIERCLVRLAEPNAGVVGSVWEIEPGSRTLRARAIAVAAGSPLGSGGAAYRDANAEPVPRDVDTVPFGCYRKDLWRQLGGYDEALLVVEDGDFNYRVRQAGLRVILDPAIRCTYFPRRRFRTLARQYLRYGWWKIPMLRKHPGALRARQLVPLVFVATFLTLAFATIWSAAAQAALFAFLGVYGGALLAGAVQAGRRSTDWRLVPLIAAAFAVIHFSWGIGGLLHLAKFGRFPRWRVGPAREAVST